MDFTLDMGMMFAMHDALRRELAQVTRIATLKDDNPGPMLRAALGWELFKKFLLVHHQTEDDILWPALRARVAGQPDRDPPAGAGRLDPGGDVGQPRSAQLRQLAEQPGVDVVIGPAPWRVFRDQEGAR